MSANGTSGTQVVTGELHRVQRGRGKWFNAEPPPEPSRRATRVAVTLALAHMIRRAIDRGEIRDQAEAARRLGLTRARLTQVLDLTLLAPEVQEAVLLPETGDLITALTAGDLRRASRAISWTQQRLSLRNERSPG